MANKKNSRSTPKNTSKRSTMSDKTIVKKGKDKGFIKFIALILVFVLLVAGVVTGLVIWLTADKPTGQTLTVEYNGVECTGTKSRLILPDEGKAKFTVKNTDAAEYKVRILANSDFDYEVGGILVAFGGEDYTSHFLTSSSFGEGYFEINCQDLSMQKILTKFWNGAQVTLPSLDNTFYFKLIVTAGDESVEIAFTLTTLVSSIKVNPDHLII